MKKKAIIIAGDDGSLAGIGNDISNISLFLQSIEGGGWNDNEIIIYKNESKNSLIKNINEIKGCYDFTMFFITGHGESRRRETFICINDKNECISENDISCISDRQINIFDCCRYESYEINESVSKCVAGLENHSDERISLAMARRFYEDRIMQSKPQQLVLYSCSINEYSLDTAHGGLYLSKLIEESCNYKNNYERFTSAISCHQKASIVVSQESKKANNTQTPDYIAVKLPTNGQLIFSVNPYAFVHHGYL
ncbi:caspase family protein [Dickeya zeae]|uniref:caspase family protein n=1 Tax=Dickeya zeae TaxID=204042 RepID=UPI00035F42C1|nr:caspase family protein [Dickeya zeae]UJR55066.1 caspase family protein [Dickeya zeae MS1]